MNVSHLVRLLGAVALALVTRSSAAAAPAAGGGHGGGGGGGAPAPAAAVADAFADNACVNCHRDLPGRSSEIVDREWKRSVHHAAKVGCEGCHGGDAAVRRGQYASDEEFKRASHLERRPEFLLLRRGREGEFVGAARGRSVSYLCGKCHTSIKEQHLGSPHGEFGDPTCLYCHGRGSHEIRPASLEIIDTRGRAEGGRCSPCHEAATMEVVARVKAMLTDAEGRIVSSGERYRQLEALGYRNLELEELHHRAGEVRSRLRQIFHSFNMKDITGHAAEIEAVSDRTDASLAVVRRLRASQRQQTVVGLTAVGLLLGFAGLLVYYKHAFLSHPSHAPSAVPARAPAPARASAAPRPSSWRGEVALPGREAAAMVDPSPPQPALERSFVRLALGLTLVHCYVSFSTAVATALMGPGSTAGSLSYALSWPLLPAGQLWLDVSRSSVFWPLWFSNSLLWGIAVAVTVYALRALMPGRPRPQ